MDLLLSEQQSQMRDGAARLLRDVAGPQRLRRLMASGRARDDEAWRAVAAAGWAGALVPERFGGTGLGTLELALFHEEAGKHLAATPLAAAASAASCIAACGNASLRARWLGDCIAGAKIVVPALGGAGLGYGTDGVLPRLRDGAVPLLDGAHSFVPFAATADAFLVAAERGGATVLGLAAPDAVGVAITTVRNVDGTSSSDIAFAATPVEIVADGSTAERAIAAMQAATVLAASAELIGIAAAVHAMALDHIKTRRQFGQAIGSFQAIQHRAVDAFVAVELSRSLLARVCVERDRGNADAAMIAAVKAKSSRSALDVVRFGLQMHGAMGYAEEHEIGLYWKRALVLSALYGGDANHLLRFSQLSWAET